MSAILESLREQVMRLAAMRARVATQAAHVTAQRSAFEITIASDVAALDESKKTLAEAESAVRGMALVHFDATQDKRPCDGVSVVMEKGYTIDKAAAFVWAQQTGLCLLPASLDEKGVKKLATATALPFVTVAETPAVRIASDLSALLVEVAI